MRAISIAATFLVSALLASPASADVRLSIEQGHVTLSAKDATVRQILAEWARVGQTKIVNAERIAGGPVTLELTNVPETEALQIILRSVSGYLAAPREQMVANASQFDRIVVMPTSSPAGGPAAAPAPTFQQTPFTPPPPRQVIEDEDDDQPSPPVPPNAPNPNPNAAPQNPRGPIFNTFPQPRGVVPTQPAAPTAYPAPTAPVGVAVPGMMVPGPAQPNQPGQPGVPQQPQGRTPDGRVIN